MLLVKDKALKTYLACGILIGLFLSGWVILTYVVFPTVSTPMIGQALLFLLIIALIIMRYSYHVTKNSNDEHAGLKVAIVTSLIAFGVTMVTLILVDNVFLPIVSQQPDRIVAFRASSFTSMRAFTNWKLFKETLIGLLGALFLGGVCGLLVTRSTPTYVRSLAKKFEVPAFTRMSIIKKLFFWLFTAYFSVLIALIGFNSAAPYSLDKMIYVVVPIMFLLWVIFSMTLIRIVWNLIRYRKFFPHGTALFIVNTFKFSAIICLVWLAMNLFSPTSTSEYEQMYPMRI